MKLCKASVWDEVLKKNTDCGAICEPGFTYCEAHKNRKKAVNERERASMEMIADANNPIQHVMNDVVDAEVVEENKKELQKAQATTTIFDRVADILDKTTKFADDAERRYNILRDDELRYYDKAGAEQLRSEVAVYERALDRQVRALTQVAKLNIEASAINVNNVVRQLITQTVMRVFVRMGLSAEQTKQARILLAEEFAKLDKE